MDIKKRIEEHDKKYKSVIFDELYEVSSTLTETIDLMPINASNLGQKQVVIPNAAITVNNKLVELSHVFKSAGISIFSMELKDIDVVSSSFLGDAIIHALINKLTQATEKLSEYSSAMEKIGKQWNERLSALENKTSSKKFFSRKIKVQPGDLSLTEEELNTLDNLLKKYEEINSEIFNYNLENDLVQSLVREIANPDPQHRKHVFNVSWILSDAVIPDLKKLGLEHLVPELQEKLIEAYKKYGEDEELREILESQESLIEPYKNGLSEEKLREILLQITESDEQNPPKL